jgi:hypothetical protein
MADLPREADLSQITAEVRSAGLGRNRSRGIGAFGGFYALM